MTVEAFDEAPRSAAPRSSGVLAAEDFEHSLKRLRRSQRLQNVATVVILSALIYWAFSVSGFIGGEVAGDPLARMARFLDLMNPDLRSDVFFEGVETDGSFASWFYALPLWIAAMWETLQMAIVSTVIGVILAVPVGLLASRNINPYESVGFTMRRILEAIRTLPDLIVAMILVAAFGIGPLAGVIALSISTMGRLGKLFAEINENADLKPIEAIRASGGGPIKALRFGLAPQVAPNYASYGLLTFEGNIGAAAALGIIGAGGIGIELSRAITYNLFDTYLALLILLVFTIFFVDIASETIRHRLMGLDGETKAHTA